MTLEEAIDHCNAVYKKLILEGCMECANEHRQLADWLTELKVRREHDAGNKDRAR